MTMKMLEILYIIVSLVTVGVHHNHRWYSLCKPWPMVILALMVMSRVSVLTVLISTLLMSVVLFSLAGDVLLLKKSFFLFGLGAFLLAHLAYIVLFFHLEAAMTFFKMILALMFGGLSAFILLPKVGRSIRLPVAAYILILSVMVWRAMEVGLTSAGWTLLPGALLFALSDFVLAWNRFVKSFKTAHWIILPSYFLAQLLMIQTFL